MEDQVVQSFSTIDFLKGFFADGGVFMFVILFVMMTGIGLAIYKYFMIRLYSVSPHRFFDTIKGLVLENKVEAAINTCSNTTAILPKVLKSGLKRANQDREAVEDAIGGALLEQTPQITYQLSYIALCANLATLLGLLGTIQGLIVSFAGVAGADPGEKARVLAEGIAKAMNTTAFGLVAAVIIMILHAILAGKCQKLGDTIDEMAVKLVDLLSIKKRKGQDV